ncbi:MAG: myo-inosose-2 dehydratase [Paenibacillaceae bacterium ZCTH02-B3]|nr:MAG: myo-inosose-2 dehydratase [Paenibacillaceae bacterium ZCTH02-B3]
MKIDQIHIGVHPINWVGEDVLEHGDHYTADDILRDVNRLGLKGVEMGRKFPTEPEELRRLLARYDVRLVSQWTSVLLSDLSCRDRELAKYRERALYLKEMGCEVISTAEIGGSLHWDPRRSENEKEVQRLNDRQWKVFAEGLNLAGEICRELGMKLVYHHHAGTVVERPEEIDRLMEMTDPELVFLLYDTGHAYYGGNDPLELLKKHIKRVGYVHLKDIRLPILEEARKHHWDFKTCIRNGVFTVPGTGGLEFRGILQTLLEHPYSGWAMLEGEQDPAKYNPYEYARRALDYILGLVNDIKGGLA